MNFDLKRMLLNKNWLKHIIILCLFAGFLSCDPYLSFNTLNIENIDDGDLIEDDDDPDNDDDDNDDDGGGGDDDEIITIEESVDDPQQTGSCDSFGRSLTSHLLDIIEIPDSLATHFDLSELMPPVRSQGIQGSCVSWATAYYLKSYQEKVQYDYDYETFDHVMSPAFVYNQTAMGNCGGGSTVFGALDILQTQGVVSWSEFPYDDQVCSEQPNDEQIELAEANQIGDYFLIHVPDSISNPNYTKINIMKTLLSENNPLVMSFSIQEVDFSYQDTLNNDYLGLTYTPDPTVTCGHAVLIVGYDDTLRAFKFVNSWGTFWGNEGYAWLSYDFFLPQEDPDYQDGVSETYVAYDKIEDGS